jgi:uncharacterized repeat protein (TIGR01451 family)
VKTYNLFPRGLVAVFFGFLAFNTFQARAIIDASLQMQLGDPSGALSDTNNLQHYLIQRTVEAIDYNDTFGLPNWASWDLTASDLGSSGRSPNFNADTNLPGGFYRVTSTDYSGSGFDRGHMCPSGDRTDNDADNALVFLMSNIIPQASVMNSGVWGSFEDYCRSLAQSGNELLIICGPGGFNGSFIEPSQRVFIPGYAWKIVVVVPAGSGMALSRITSATRVIAIKIPNNDSVSANWQNYVTSAREIEVDTGYSFFTALPQGLAEVLRDKVDGQVASPPTISGFSGGSGAVGSSVIISGSSFGSASAVTFNGVAAAFHVDSAIQITAMVPTNAISGPISVTIPTGTAISSGAFTVTDSNPDLVTTVSHFGNFSQNDIGDTYTIVVTNVGTIASTGVVTVAEELPAGLTVTSMSGVGWTVDLVTLTGTRSNSLFAGAIYPPITVVVNVASNAPAIVTNSAIISGGGETNTANDLDLDITTINSSAGGGGPVSTLFGWDTSTLPGGSGNFGPTPFAPTFVGANLTVGGLTRGSGIGTSGTGAARAWGGNGFTATDAAGAVTANDLITFNATASTGYTVSYTAISKLDYRHSATGPANGVLQYQIGSGGFNDITALSYPDSSSGGASLSPINLTGIAALQNVAPGTNVTFRIVNYGGTSSGGTWYIYDVSNSPALDLAIQGTISAISTTHPDLIALVEHTGNFRQGDNNDTYTIIVTNIGTAGTVGTITLVDSLPAGLTASAISGPGWTTDLSTLTCSRAESLAPGMAYPPLTLVVNIATNAGLSLTNVAIVSGGGETNVVNDTASDPTTVIALTPVQFWRLQWFGIADNVGPAADGAVASSDGMPNLLKYAFGLNPFVPANSPVIADVTTGYLRLTAPKNSGATDVAFIVETASTLTSSWTTNGVVIDQNGPSVFQAHSDGPIGSSTTGFIRLSVLPQ